MTAKIVGIDMIKLCKCGCGEELEEYNPTYGYKREYKLGHRSRLFVGKEHPMYGRKHKPNSIEKMRLAKTAENHPMYGRHQSEETRKRRSDTLTIDVGGGEKVSYATLHKWVRTNKPKPDNCQSCGKNKLLYVCNISGKYLRDLSDYKYLCAKCHRAMDRLPDDVPRDPSTNRYIKQSGDRDEWFVNKCNELINGHLQEQGY